LWYIFREGFYDEKQARRVNHFNIKVPIEWVVGGGGEMIAYN